MGHDPLRHGRFIIIVDRRKIAFIKQTKRMLFKLYPKFSYSVPDTTIFITLGSVLEVIKIRQSLKKSTF